jgi:ribA/ribD-fused uncharacterized protein
VVTKYFGNDPRIQFRGELYYLSNFYPDSPFYFKKTKFKTSEHFFMTFKTLDKLEQSKIINAPTASAAKKLGKLVKLRPDWEDIKFNVMYMAIYLKFTQNTDILEKLLNIDDDLLIENNIHHDDVWGNCLCPKHVDKNGQNYLGRLLKKLKYDLLKELKRI